MKALWICLVTVAIALSSCDQCYNVACNEPDVAFINGLQFEFDRSSFTFEEVSNATVLRFHPGNFEQPIDTIYLKDVLSENDLTFFIPLTSNDLTTGALSHIYGIYDNSRENAFIITDITTKGIYPTDCCCCYHNTTKTFVLNGEPVDRTGSTNPVQLSK
ncbi:MAG: hypothetical protein K9J06_00085 [Flavobacteriales bacterium]|nr:hypothetical protein [Flavobacteriales bacterium]